MISIEGIPIVAARIEAALKSRMNAEPTAEIRKKGSAAKPVAEALNGPEGSSVAAEQASVHVAKETRNASMATAV
jgi:hypothetical protein